MALLGNISVINDGYQENDGTGESIRSAFVKVNDNFNSVKTFLVQGSLPGDIAVDFYNANVTQLFRAATANINNLITNTITTVGNITPSSNVSGNVGSAIRWYNTVYAATTKAIYADLAEQYHADADYDPGTVVIFGGDAEITVSNLHGDTRVAGVVSTNPAYLMNAEAPGLPIALRGRTAVKVVGAVCKGDGLVTSTVAGFATSIGTELDWGRSVFAKSLETDLSPGEKVIEAVII